MREKFIFWLAEILKVKIFKPSDSIVIEHKTREFEIVTIQKRLHRHELIAISPSEINRILLNELSIEIARSGFIEVSEREDQMNKEVVLEAKVLVSKPN